MVSTHRLFDKQLEALELQINRYQGLLSLGFTKLQFPADIEKSYVESSNTLFINSSRITLSLGILFYLIFGFADFVLGQEQVNTLWIIRALISAVMLVALGLIFNRRLSHWVVNITALGMIIIGLSVVLFIYLLEEPYSYGYHLGLIPWQVFVLVSLRSHVRAIMISSVIVFVAYILVAYSKEYSAYHPEIDHLVYIMLPLFSTFWGLLIAMGVYLGYEIEKSTRIGYVKNHLLALDTQRLTLLGEELHQLSTTDSLTGLANRRHFEVCFDLEWRKAVRTQDSIALIMIDIDNFKKYNDFYGHQAGDECLRQVCAALNTYAQRSGELVVRYGGEEFVVLLPRMTLTSALRIAQSICLRVRELNIPHIPSDEHYVTVSIGVAALVPNLRDDPESLLRSADRCLYEAKARGRNQVVS